MLKYFPLLKIAGAYRRTWTNFVAGTGIALDVSGDDVTIRATGTGGSGGVTELTATGAINGGNAAYVFTEKPAYIYADGAKYRENHGWTWNSGTLTATLSFYPTFDVWGEV